MTDAKSKRIRSESPSVALMAAAAAQAGPDEVKRFASVFDKLPADLVMGCIEFLTLWDARQTLHVRALRKALGGKDPPSHIAIKELRMPVCSLQYSTYTSDDQLVANALFWRRHVRVLNAMDTWRIFTQQPIMAAIRPKTTVFPRLKTLRFEVTFGGHLTGPVWKTLLERCPLLDDITVHHQTSLVWSPQPLQMNG
jgi:hypothetical protein